MSGCSTTYTRLYVYQMGLAAAHMWGSKYKCKLGSPLDWKQRHSFAHLMKAPFVVVLVRL